MVECFKGLSFFRSRCIFSTFVSCKGVNVLYCPSMFAFGTVGRTQLTLCMDSGVSLAEDSTVVCPWERRSEQLHTDERKYVAE